MKMFQRVVATLGAFALLSALALPSGVAQAQTKTKVSVAVGGAGCLCYLPTVLAKQLGEYDKAGLDVELINFKGGSQALQAPVRPLQKNSAALWSASVRGARSSNS